MPPCPTVQHGRSEATVSLEASSCFLPSLDSQKLHQRNSNTPRCKKQREFISQHQNFLKPCCAHRTKNQGTLAKVPQGENVSSIRCRNSEQLCEYTPAGRSPVSPHPEAVGLLLVCLLICTVTHAFRSHTAPSLLTHSQVFEEVEPIQPRQAHLSGHPP